MKLLVIGGTRFLGRQIVTAALARGHEVTLFNRGRQELPAGVESIQGDRHQDLDKLQGRRWDAVIDTCGYLPRSVEASAAALADSVERYVFISSISALADTSSPGVDESGKLAELDDEQRRELGKMDPASPGASPKFGEMYGALKVLCERAAENAMPGRVINIRPGLIVGEGDYSDRFTYWPARIARGGEVLAPGRPGRFVQMIDVADLGRFTVLMAESKGAGAYNASGVPGELTMATVLDACKGISGSDASFTWVDEEFLLARGVKPWMEMPLWIPESDESMRGFMAIDCSKAYAAGLTIRPIGETVRDTLAWHRARGSPENLKAGLAAGKEQELLRDWHASR